MQFDVDMFKDKSGLEIGGTSPYFEKIYSVASSIKQIGFPTVDVTALPPLGDFDFVLSCNVLEHVANPIKAVYQQMQVLKQNGLLVIVVPKKEKCFDCNREITLFEHLIWDFYNTDETDLTHVEEVVSTFDFSKHPIDGGMEKLKEQCLVNYRNRFLHHHVFNSTLLQEICIYCELLIRVNTQFDDNNYIIIAQKGDIK